MSVVAMLFSIPAMSCYSDFEIEDVLVSDYFLGYPSDRLSYRLRESNPQLFSFF